MTKAVLKDIPIEKLQRGVYQPRFDFNPDALKELAASIESQGVIEPLVVRPIADNRYEIVAGERRWRAAQLAQLHDVPCIVRQYRDDVAAEVTIIENVQRQDLNPIEEALAYQRLIDEFSYIHEEVAAAVGKSRAKISNCLRLLKLNIKVQEAIKEGLLGEGHGKVLAALDTSEQWRLAQKAIAKDWSVRKLEREVKAINVGGELLCSDNDPNVKQLEKRLSDHFGSKVNIHYDTNGRGKLAIDFHNYDIFQGIVDKIKQKA
jgi:ParB family transcriptional regulator, chromosome partitioning protein